MTSIAPWTLRGFGGREVGVPLRLSSSNLSWMDRWRTGALSICVALAAIGCSPDPGTNPPDITVDSEWVRPPLTIVDDSVLIRPGESIQDAVDAGKTTEVFVLAAGIHRLQTVTPKNGQRFIGEEGAIVSGALELDEFERVDDVWVHDGVSGGGEERGRCRRDAPACSLPEDLYIDDQLIERVADRSGLQAGTWYLDQQESRLYLASDPTGHVVELSVLPVAFGGEASDVSIEGLVIEKYANPAQRGAIAAGRDWSISASEVRFNHGVGIKTGAATQVLDSHIHHNGQLGIGGGGVGVLIEGSEIAFNGIAGFNPSWEAGGIKAVFTTNLVVRNNLVYSNRGPGVWSDAGGDGTVYEGNRILNNEHAGIKHEISGSALVRSNTIIGNGFAPTNRERWPGILLRESGPVVVESNVLASNVDPLTLLEDDDRNNPTENHLHEISVFDNDISFDGGLLGYRGDIDSQMIGNGIRFYENRYFGEEERLRFRAYSNEVDLEEWRQLTGDDSSVQARDELEYP